MKNMTIVRTNDKKQGFDSLLKTYRHYKGKGWGANYDRSKKAWNEIGERFIVPLGGKTRAIETDLCAAFIRDLPR